jgi:subfamily B ATP-binding cassette protein MsbA
MYYRATSIEAASHGLSLRTMRLDHLMHSVRRLLAFFLRRGGGHQLLALRELGVLRYRDALMVGALTIVSAFLETSGVALVLPILDFVNHHGDVQTLMARSRLWKFIGDVFQLVGLDITLAALCISVVVLICLRQVATFVRTIVIAAWKENAGRDISVRCFRAILAAEPRYIQNFGQGRFLTLLSEDAQFTASLLNTYATTFALIVTCVTYAALVIGVAPLASLLAFIIFGIVSFWLNHFIRIGDRLAGKALVLRENYSELIAERYRGWILIKLANTLSSEALKARKFAQEVVSARVAIARNEGKLGLVVSPIMVAITLGCLYFAVQVLALTTSVITLFILVLVRLIPLAQSLAAQRQVMVRFGASLNRIQEVLQDCKVHAERDTGSLPFISVGDGIIFQNVEFRYQGAERSTLHDVSAMIPAGKMTAIVGPSGAGKSTLVSLILRLERPQAGSIRIGGVPIDQYQLASLRRHIAFVEQNPFLLKGSVRENLCYLRSAATESEIVEACRMAHADEFVRRLPRGYDTVLGEGGQGLSGGERQRLVLARALLAGARILVLDEPTSALDFESEREVQAALYNILDRGDMTLVVIAHRLSTIHGADHLIVLDGGRVVRTGAPSVLQQDDNWYRRMVDAHTVAK